jgi:hypothetical protein
MDDEPLGRVDGGLDESARCGVILTRKSGTLN